ncbi:hypothetical protein GCM10008985_01030 [Halococcus dombrowskii]|uniref:Uncharacterized protein n=1 Tax=Halococcus dombrowskii TaxID=179637 RepID=A0AAV3SBR8_HALDO
MLASLPEEMLEGELDVRLALLATVLSVAEMDVGDVCEPHAHHPGSRGTVRPADRCDVKGGRSDTIQELATRRRINLSKAERKWNWRSPDGARASVGASVVGSERRLHGGPERFCRGREREAV